MKRFCFFLSLSKDFFTPLTHIREIEDLIVGAFSLKERIQKEATSLGILYQNPYEEQAVCEGFFFPQHIAFDPIDLKTILKTNTNTVFKDEQGEILAFFIKDNTTPYTDINDLHIRERIIRELECQEVVIPLERVLYRLQQISDIIEIQHHILGKDLDFYKKTSSFNYKGAIEGPSSRLFIGERVHIGAHVVFNTQKGAILIEDGASIGALSYIQGPCIIKSGAHIDQARVRGSYIGIGAKIGGEVEESIFLEYSNKHHDGFVGHSYIGSFVNFGALATTSDLKNNYHPITLEYGKQTIKTQSLKLGSFIGDFTKLGIGVLLNTGSMIGVGCSLIHKEGFLPRNIESFTWGAKEGRSFYSWDTFLEDTQTILRRRGQELSLEQKDSLWDLYQKTALS